MIKKQKQKENSAGGVVYYLENGKLFFLLIKTKYGMWSFPKGHIEKGEDPITAAEREITEETGAKDLQPVIYLSSLDLKFIRDYDGSNERIDKKVKFYLFKASSLELGPADHEAKWVEKDEVMDTLEYINAKKLFKRAIKKVDKHERLG